MTEFGYALSSEEHGPDALINNARKAEATGFEFAMVSDHFHPWIGAQGQSPFVWSVIGGIARETKRLRLGTGVTCPTMRIHPAIVAQAAATSGVLMGGRFFLGVGAGENLNEHVVGGGWPAPDKRLAMLEESIEIFRLLWQGGTQTHRGEFYDVEQACIYTLPDQPVEIAVAGGKPKVAELAGHAGDAFVNTAPDKNVIDAFDGAGGRGKPKYGQITVCWAESEEAGARTACEIWPNAVLGGDLTYELPLPEHFEQATANVTPEDLARSIPCGPDPDRYLEDIRTYEQAGYTHIYFHQIGSDQEGFFQFWTDELAPRL
jgi:G6PDH family F420-dependent oxidoreductase